MRSTWKHFSLCSPLLLGARGRKGLCVSWGLGACFFFAKCVVYLVLQRWCTMVPLIVHILASSCLLDFSFFPSCSTRQDGQTVPVPDAVLRVTLPCTVSQCCPDDLSKKLSLKTKQERLKKCLWAVAYCLQATLGIPKLSRGCWNNSVQRAQALCSVFHVYIVLAKWLWLLWHEAKKKVGAGSQRRG